MTDDNKFGLSRRRLLGGLATVGAAGALGGAGSFAFFSDDETFANNRLVAGELDMKVDWEEHYSDWKGEELDHAEMADPGDADYLLPAFTFPEDFIGGDGPAGLASPDDAMPIALNFTTSQDDFWDVTSIEAYPDADDDGIQDQDEEHNPVFPNAESICDTDSDLNAALDSELRTEQYRSEPLINIEDVKPGDFGEVTFSLHLCDNPGYVWMNGGLVDASENGVNDPEEEDEDEDQVFGNDNPPLKDPDNDSEKTVELLDYILTRIWRDDGNNQVDRITGQLDICAAIDTSGSLSSGEMSNLQAGVNAFISALDDSDADVHVGTVEFGGGDVGNVNNLQDPGGLSVSLPSSGDGNTPMPGALDIADQIVNDNSMAGGGRSGAEKVVVVFTDGGPNYLNTSYSANGYNAPRNNSADWSAVSGDSSYDNADGPGGTVTEAEMDETALVADSVKDGGTTIATVYVGDDDTQAMTAGAISAYTSLPDFLADHVASSGSDAFDVTLDDLADVADQLVALVTTAEDVLFVGTLRQALDELSSGNGFALEGDIEAEEAGGTGEQGCFAASNTHHIGFEWWLPINHGNQVQSDSATFDIGFYTEQCRHNDGTGIGNMANS